MHYLTVVGIFAVCGLSAPAFAQSMQSQANDNSQVVLGYDQVREVIRKRCATCHNPDEMRGDLDLSTFESLLAGASSGPIVVAGKPNQSLLFKSAAHLEDPVMPPNSPKIPGRELDIIRRWIEGGLAAKTETRSTLPTEAMQSQAVKESAVASTDTSKLQPSSSATKVESRFAPVRGLLRSTAIAALDAHPKQNIVAVSGNQQAVLLDLATGRWLGAFDFPEGDVTALRFSRDGRLLIAAGGVAGLSGRVVAFEVATGKRIFELADEKDTILSVDLSPDGSQLALGGPAKVVRIYKVASGEVVHTLRKHTDWVLAVRFSGDGLLLASGDRFGGLFVWDPSRGTEFHTLRGHAGPVNSIAWDNSGDTLVSGGEDGRLRTWNLHHGELTSQWDAGVGAVLSLATNGALVACGGRNKILTVWNGPNQTLGSHSGLDQVERVAIAADGKSLVAADAAGNVSLLDLQSVKEQQSLSLPIDEAELQVVFKRMEQAETDYASRLSEKPLAPQTPVPDAEPPAIADANAQPSSESAVLALKSEIESSRQNTAALRQNAAAISKSLSITAKTLQQLQQSQVELQAQLEKQDLLLAASEQQTAAIESAYANLLASNPQLSADATQQQKRSLHAKLERQRKLLAISLQLLDQVNGSSDSQKVDADLQRTNQLVLDLTHELRNRIDEVTTWIDAVDDNSATRPSLVDAEK